MALYIVSYTIIYPTIDTAAHSERYYRRVNSQVILLVDHLSFKENLMTEYDLTPINSISGEIVLYDTTFQNNDSLINQALRLLKLPSQKIVNPVVDRVRVFKNLEDIISDIDVDEQTKQYLSKYVYSAANGLFDAALNYIWNAIELDIRNKINRFDLNYFFEIIGQPSYSEFKDMSKIQSADLIRGAKDMELISEQTYLKLENIRNMRNHISSAHPNESDITASELIEWLETAVRYVFEVKPTANGIATKKLLENIKKDAFSGGKVAAQIAAFQELPTSKASVLMKGFFGIFTKTDTSETSRDNISKLAPSLWVYTDEETKYDIGFKYGNYLLNSKDEEITSAKRFLNLVDGNKYIPVKNREAEISTSIDSLISAHINSNNFYTEPIVARDLAKFHGVTPEMSDAISKKFVRGIVNVFLTNGYGVAWEAEPIYIQSISDFSGQQAAFAVTLFTDDVIKNKLENSLSQAKFKEMLDLIEIKLTGKTLLLVRQLKSLSDVQLKTAYQNVNITKQFSDLISTIKSVN